jgi:hypothetical protein
MLELVSVIHVEKQFRVLKVAGGASFVANPARETYNTLTLAANAKSS